MIHSQMFDTLAPEAALASRKRWMAYALAISLMLHLLVIAFIIAAGSAAPNTQVINGILVEEIALSPTMRPVKVVESSPAPVPPEAEPPSDASSDEKPLPESPAAETSPQEKGSGRMNELMTTPLGLGMSYGYVSSLAEGRSLRDDIRGYYFELVEKINREWWKRAEGLKEPVRQDGFIELYIQSDGSIISQRMYQGTGSREADLVIQDVIKAVSPFPPLPADFNQRVFLAPLRIKAPSNLFRFRG